jgi:hypothetical protein
LRLSLSLPSVGATILLLAGCSSESIPPQFQFLGSTNHNGNAYFMAFRRINGETRELYAAKGFYGVDTWKSGAQLDGFHETE